MYLIVLVHREVTHAGHGSCTGLALGIAQTAAKGRQGTMLNDQALVFLWGIRLHEVIMVVHMYLRPNKKKVLFW